MNSLIVPETFLSVFGFGVVAGMFAVGIVRNVVKRVRAGKSCAGESMVDRYRRAA